MWLGGTFWRFVLGRGFGSRRTATFAGGFGSAWLPSPVKLHTLLDPFLRRGAGRQVPKEEDFHFPPSQTTPCFLARSPPLSSLDLNKAIEQFLLLMDRMEAPTKSLSQFSTSYLRPGD